MALPHPEDHEGPPGEAGFPEVASGEPWRLDPARDTEAESILAGIYGPQAEEMAEELISRLAAAFVRADEVDPELRRDVMDQARVTLARAVRLLGSGESFESLGPVIEEVARRRRRQQLSQEIIFSGYRYLQHMLFERVTEEVRDHPHSRRLIDALALRQLEFQWVVSRRVAAAFDQGPEVVAASREESAQGVLEILVGHRVGPPNTLADHATQFGLLLPPDRLTVTQVPSGSQAVALAGPDVRVVARSNPWSVVGELSGRVIVISRGRPWGLTAAHGGCSLTSEHLARPDLMAERVALASRAADVTPKLGLLHADADEMAPFIAVASLPADQQEAFLRSCFGELHIGPRGLPILKAVAVSARSAGRKEAAALLRVHPNTLDYRLARFREMTGINLTDPIQRMRCDLGLFLLGLFAD